MKHEINQMTVGEQKTLNERLINRCHRVRKTIDDIKKLVAMGADINCRCSSVGNTPLMASVSTNYHYNSSDNYNACKFLIESGASVDVQNQYGHTALMYSVYDINLMKLVLKYHPNIDLVNVLNDNVLDMCKQQGYTEHVELLEEHIEQNKKISIQ